jgi:hypothetical protein
MTFVSFLFVMAIVVVTVLFILRLFPLYNEKFQVEAAMQTVISQPDAAHKTVAETRRAFLTALRITNITRFNDRTVRQHVFLIRPKSSTEPPMLHVKYQATNILIGDLELLMNFDKQIPITTSAGTGGN